MTWSCGFPLARDTADRPFSETASGSTCEWTPFAIPLLPIAARLGTHPLRHGLAILRLFLGHLANREPNVNASTTLHVSRADREIRPLESQMPFSNPLVQAGVRNAFQWRAACPKSLTQVLPCGRVQNSTELLVPRAFASIGLH